MTIVRLDLRIDRIAAACEIEAEARGAQTGSPVLINLRKDTGKAKIVKRLRPACFLAALIASPLIASPMISASGCRAGPLAGHFQPGRRKWKIDPFPGSDSTQMCP